MTLLEGAQRRVEERVTNPPPWIGSVLRGFLKSIPQDLRMPPEDLLPRALVRHQTLWPESAPLEARWILLAAVEDACRAFVQRTACSGERRRLEQVLKVFWQHERHALLRHGILRPLQHIVQGMLDALPYAVAVLDPSLRVCLANAAMAALAERPREALMGERLPERVSLASLPEMLRLLERRGEAAQGTVLQWQDRVRLPTAAEQPVQAVLVCLPPPPCSPWPWDVLQPWAVLLMEPESGLDVQSQLFQADKLAAVGHLVAGVSHELNNPLTGIMGYTQLLLRDAGLEDKARRWLERIHAGAQQAAHIVKQLLTFARQQAPEQQAVGINGILRSALDLLEYQLQRDNIRIERRLAPDEKIPRVGGDYYRLQQVFLNILINAHQAMAGTGKPGVLSVETECIQDRVRVTIADTGPGIHPAHLGRIFDPFFTTKPPGQGTGLGLSVAYGIVRDHGGMLRVESAPGRGARFTVELPVLQEPVPVSEGTPPETDPAERGRRVLVVDDEESVLEVCFHALLAMGCRPDLARNGRTALQKLQQQSYHLVLLNLHLPERDGQTLFRDLRQRWPEQAHRVLFITGDTLSASVQTFLKESGRPFLPKPFGIEELQQAVREELRRHASDPLPGTP